MIEEILTKDIEDSFRFAADVSRFLSQTSSSFIIIHYPEREVSWKSGLDEIIDKPEFMQHDIISEFLCLVDSIEEKMDNLEIQKEVKIYIGEEIPILKAGNMSIICARIGSNNTDKHDADIALIGPKRMNYSKNVSLIKHLNRILNELN